MAMTFGEYLKELRERQPSPLSLRDVQQYTGISNSYLAQVENGERGIPTYKVLKRLADLYGVRAAKLVEVAETAEGETHSDPSSPNRPTVKERRLLSGYNVLSEKGKDYLEDTLTLLLRSEKKPEPFKPLQRPKNTFQPSSRTRKVRS